MLFDTHAHYYAEAFDPDRDAVLSALPAAGVGLVLCPGCDLDTSRQSIQLAEALPPCLRRRRGPPGGRPWGCGGLAGPGGGDDPPPQGEGHWGDRPGLLLEGGPPGPAKGGLPGPAPAGQGPGPAVIVHDREAHADCLAIVREFPGVRGVFHCYSGSAEDAKTLVKLGWHLSFTGTITFKNARKAPEVIAAVPLERIMVETDAPYMAPTPFRGKRCDSRYVYRMAETIAEIKGLTPAEVEQATTENGKALFAIPITGGPSGPEDFWGGVFRARGYCDL